MTDAAARSIIRQMKIQTSIMRELLVEFRIYNDGRFPLPSGSSLQPTPSEIRERTRTDVNARITAGDFIADA